MYLSWKRRNISNDGLDLWCLTPLLNTVSVISWQSVLLVEETGVPGENLFNDENI
jgi:hypothetical protein